MTYTEVKEQAKAKWQGLSAQSCCIFVDPGSSCASRANPAVFNQLVADVAQLSANARVISTGSLGWREVEPIVAIQKPGKPRIYYANVTPAIAQELVQCVVVGDEIRADLAMAVESDSDYEGIPAISTLPFFTKQSRVLLRNCGRIGAEAIDHAIANGAYEGLDRALAMTPESVLQQIESVLDDDTVAKWRMCQNSPLKDKYVVARVSDGGELSRDVFLLEGDPHALLEGLLIAAYSVGANRAVVCVDAQDVIAKRRLELALEQMRRCGLLGENILEPKFNCEIELREVKRGLGGEEDSIIINFLEGRPARASVPYSERSDVRARAAVGTTEDFVKLSAVMRDQSQAASIRAAKVLAVTGCVEQTGIIEVSQQTSLRDVINSIAGGAHSGSELKAVQIGAPSGGVVPTANLDISLKEPELAGAGCSLGSGTLAAFDAKQCAIEIARHAAMAAHSASCGQCTFGREGTRQLMDVLSDLTCGRAKDSDINLLTNINDSMKLASLCVNGRKAPDAVVTTLQHFRSEYDAHVNGKRCPMEACEMK